MQAAITTQIYVKTLKRADGIGCDKKMAERVRLPRQEAEDRRTRQPVSIVEDDAGEEEDKEGDEGASDER